MSRSTVILSPVFPRSLHQRTPAESREERMRMNPAVAALVALSPVLLAWSPVQQTHANPAPSVVKSSALTSSALAFSTGAWSQYHRDNFHQANDQTISTTASVSVGWTSPALSDPVYTEPLVWNGLVY